MTLLVIGATLAVGTAIGRPLGQETLVHLGILAALLSGGALARRVFTPEGVVLINAVAVIAVMFFLYTSLGTVAFEAIPWRGDQALLAADRMLGFGRAPGIWISDHVATCPWAVEGLAAFYGGFIPYLYLTIFLGLLGRPPEARQVFVLAFALLYAVSFMGYLFVPAQGPILAAPGEYQAALQGGVFLRLVVRSIDALGGPHGAFPSLHVGASVLAMTFDLRYGDRLRGLVYMPLVLLIALATLVLRYHYVVDLFLGAGLALGGRAGARWWYDRADRAGEG